MNIDDGIIEKLTPDELNLSVEELKDQLHKTKLNAEELGFLMALEQQYRPKALREMRSKDYENKRRAKRKMAKASKQRNG